MKTNWIAQTLTRIESGTLTEGQIRIICRRISRALDPYWRTDADRGMSQIAALEIWERIKQRRPFVTDAQARKGAAWLQKVAFTPKGTQRRTDLAREFTPADLEVIKALQPAPVFCLVDLRAQGSRAQYFPVYKALSDAGAFEYCAAAWQSGARSFVSKHAAIACTFPAARVIAP